MLLCFGEVERREVAYCGVAQGHCIVTISKAMVLLCTVTLWYCIVMQGYGSATFRTVMHRHCCVWSSKALAMFCLVTYCVGEGGYCDVRLRQCNAMPCIGGAWTCDVKLQ